MIFTPLTVGGSTLANRIVLSPMCRYSAGADGVPTVWHLVHLVHLGARAIGGFGLVLTESTAVSPEGRISPRDVGLWSAEQVAGWRRITDFAHGPGHADRGAAGPRGPQGLHLRPGRRARLDPPVRRRLAGPGPVPAGLPRLRRTRERGPRAGRGGVRRLRLPGGGGRLRRRRAACGARLPAPPVPVATVNRRTDAYGGSFENRVRLLLEVVEAVRAAWHGPLFVRVAATDWVEGGWTAEETVAPAPTLRDRGVDLLDVTTGGLDPDQVIPVGPGYQVPFAAQVREKTGLPVGAVGLITEPDQAEAILADGHADLVFLARAAVRPRRPTPAEMNLSVAESMIEQH